MASAPTETSSYKGSHYTMGSYRDGKWYCQCDSRAAWRTSRTGATSGERFLRCDYEINVPQCGFFLWEEDEAAAREQVLTTQEPVVKIERIEIISRPQTPTRTLLPESTYSETITGLPTPDSRRDRARVAIGLNMPPRDTSPTPTRHGNTSSRLTFDSKDDDLYTQIKALLALESITLKRTTEVQIRNYIDMKLLAYEAKIETCQRTIGELTRIAG